MTRLPDPWWHALFRFIAVSILAMSGALTYQDEIVNGLLPLFRAWLEIVDDTYRTVDLSLINAHGESMLRRIVTPCSLQIVAGAMVYPDSTLQISTQATTGMVLQPLILGLGLLLGMPWKNSRELSARLVIATLLLTLTMLLDVPTMLYGFAWFDELKSIHADQFSLLVTWADAMNAGGRYALALVAVFASFSIANFLSSILPGSSRKPGPNNTIVATSV